MGPAGFGGKVKPSPAVPSMHNGYSIFQGGIPEVEEFSRKFHK